MIPCSIERLQSALAGSLPADDEAALCRHLDECDSCGAEMERLAMSDGLRAETVALLADDEWDVDVPTRDDWSPADFTVEHLDPSDEPNVLGRLGGYDVLEIVGRGGMGVVLKAFDRDLKRCVAIKVLAPHLAQSSLARKRFAREARAAAAVVHPNVLAIHHVQPTGPLPFLVMPLVAGESLAHRIASQGTLSLEETLRIGMQAAAGLAAAHEQGLVHRDVKPANILLEKGVERAVLMDFGLARAADDVTLTRRGLITGTPQYMSPEQARGEPLDGRSDLFSLGCVLYEMATGVSPFRTDSMLATLRRLVDDAPRPLTSLNPELPGWFVAIVDRLLEKDPARRFGSAKEVSELLEGCVAHLQQPGANPLPPTLAASSSGSGRRRIGVRGVLTLFAGLVVVLFGGLVLATAEPDIVGTWSGDDWGTVVLKKTEAGHYEGTYTDTFGKTPGAIRLSWSRIERRFNGTWREGDDRFGDLSVRLVGKEIRGAFTTDRKAKINPATPGLADLAWVRAKAAAGTVRADDLLDDEGKLRLKALEKAKRFLEASDGPESTFWRGTMVWGPALERTIVEEGKERWALNLATGKIVTSPSNPPLDVSESLRAAKADLYSPTNAAGTLVAFDMYLVPLDVPPEDWDIVSTNEAVARLDKLLNPEDPAFVKKFSEVQKEIYAETLKIEMMSNLGKGRQGADDFAQIAKMVTEAKIARNNKIDSLEALIAASKDQRRDKAAAPRVPPKSQTVAGRKLYAFRTREGAMGLLRIVESREDAQPVKSSIRYKLLRQGEPRMELIALAKYPSAGGPWWTPEGRLLKKPPVDPSSVDLRKAETPGKVWYTALFRIPLDGLDPGRVDRDDAIRGIGVPLIRMARPTREKTPVSDLAAVAIALPDSATQASLAMEVAKTWANLRAGGYVATVEGERLRDNDHASEAGTDWKVIDRKGRLHLLVDYPKADEQVRISFTRDLKKGASSWRIGDVVPVASPDDFRSRVEVKFSGDLDLSGECRFHLEKREFEKLEFPNVVLSGAKSTDALPPLSWGPVVERTIMEDGKEPWALNLATGKVVTSTPSLPLDFSFLAPHSLRAAKVDLFLRKAPTKGKLGMPDMFLPPDMGVVELGETEEDWSLSPSDVIGLLANVERDGNRLLTGRHVYAFISREGATGLLKIVKIREDGKPAKTVVRYKLVQKGESKAAPTASLLATKEQVTRIEALLKTVPVSTNYLTELYEATPGVPGEIRIRSDIERLPIRSAEKSPLESVPLGEVLLRKGGSTYIKWDDLGSSTHHYYGPIHGDGIEKLGLQRVPISEPKQADPPKESRATWGPTIERVLPFSSPGKQYYFQFRGDRMLYLGYGTATTKERADEDKKRADAAGGRISNHCYLDGWSPENWRWVEAAGGVDLLAVNLGTKDVPAGSSDEKLQFLGEGCVFTNEHLFNGMHDPSWDKQTAENTFRQLLRAKEFAGRIEPKRKELPASYLFKTARGDFGMVEFRETVEDERGYLKQGVRMRYKLVQPADARQDAKDTAN